MSADRPTCDLAGERVSCPPGEVVISDDGRRARATWHPTRGVTRTALFRLVTDDGVAVLQHVRTVRCGGREPARTDLDPDARLADVPRCRRGALRELGLTPAEEGSA